MKENPRKVFLRILLFVFVIIITILIFNFRDSIQKLSNYGYVGIFLLSILANATVILPLPGVLLTSAMGAIFSPIGVAIASGAGATVGELTGYLAGFSGNAIIENQVWHDKFTKWMEKFGNISLLFLAFIPNPLFDLAGIAAGMMKMKIGKFLFWVFLGKLLKMLLFAFTGERLFIFFSGFQ